MCVYMCILYIRVCKCVYMCVNACIMYACICACVLCVHAYACVYIYVYGYMCTCACACVIEEVDASSVIVQTSVFQNNSYSSFLGCKMNSIELTGVEKEEIDTRPGQNKKEYLAIRKGFIL